MSLFSKNNDSLPEFWIKYLDAFAKEKKEKSFFKKTVGSRELQNTRFVVFDTETTGLDYKKDRILSLGGVAVVGNQVIAADTLELFLKQDFYNPDSAQIHGILKQGNYLKVNEKEAIAQCLDFISTDILVGHHVGFDVAVVNQSLKRAGLGRLKNRQLDTEILYKRLVHPVNRPLQDKRYTLDELAEALKIPLHDRHTAAGDSLITALVFIKIVHKLNSDGEMKLKHLFR